MSDNIITAKNTFAEGLIMDLAPDNTQANTLSSALNATLITFNGNELSLQNDMGNGRVETARLPEGYIPLGSCEFGDIIYIVSYNPISNKSLIGCFPSPERNISSDEVSQILLIINYTDFLEVINDNPTGKIKANAIKKVLIGSKKLNPGDKFIIYSEERINGLNLSDFGNTTHECGKWPKLLRFHVVSIDDNGKITYLDSDIKWYDNDYFIKDNIALDKETLKPDLDAYRNLVDSAYSIFQSKNSGKLAILAELEKITGFNCAYSVNVKKKDEIYNDYNIFLHASWTTEHNDVNPIGLAVINSEWLGDKTGNYVSYNSETGVQNPPIKLELPIQKQESNKYDIEVPFSRIYKQENLNISYEDYIKNKSFNALIKDEHNNKYVGWDNIANNDKLRSVTRINQKKNSGYFVRTKNNMGEYYFNLDRFNEGKAETKGNDNNFYPTRCAEISDDVVVNYFKKDISFPLVTVPIQTFSKVKNDIIENDLTNLIWKFTVAPCMPYGVLEEYAIDIIIDFSKVGKNLIEFKNWKYFNLADLSTLTYGFNINLDEITKVKEVTLDFYDNQGIAATYHNNNKTSYSGVFTERFGLNDNNTNPKLTNIDSLGNNIYHAGAPVSVDGELNGDLVVWDPLNPDPNKQNPRKYISKEDISRDKIFLNDAGTLYSNILYKVLITISYGPTDELENFVDIKTKTYSRWFWTNSMYNDYYYNTLDFNILNFELGLANSYKIESTNNYKLYNANYSNVFNKLGTNPKTDSLGAGITFLNLNGQEKGNLKLTTKVGLKDYFNTFYLSNEDELLNNIKVSVALGRSELIIDKLEILYESIPSEDVSNILSIPDKDLENSTGTLPVVGPVLQSIFDSTLEQKEIGKDLWEEGAVNNYYDTFNMSFYKDIPKSNETYTHPETGKTYKIQQKLETTLKELNSGVLFTLTGICFNKLRYNGFKEVTGLYPKVEPIIRSKKNRDILNISFDALNNVFYFDTILAINFGGIVDGGMLIKHYSNILDSDSFELTQDIGNSTYVTPTTQRIIEGVNQLGLNSPLILILWSDIWRTHGKNHGNKRMYCDESKLAMRFVGREDDRYMLGINSDNIAESAIFLLFLNVPRLGFYPLNEFTSYGEHGGPNIPLTQQCSIPTNLPSDANSTFIKNTYKKECSIANLVVQVLSNVYRQSEELTPFTWNKLNNLCFLKDFNETWSKHIIINSKVDENIDKNIITFGNGVGILQYINAINKHFKPVDYECLDANVTLILQDYTLYIDFKYQIPSNNNLKKAYQDLSNNVQSVIFKSDAVEGVPSTRVFNDMLMWENDKGELVELSKDFKYKLRNYTWKDTVGESDLIMSEALAVNGDKNGYYIPVTNLSKLISYDSKNLFTNYNYPFTNMTWIASAEDDSDRSTFNFSTDTSFTGLNIGFKS